MTGSELEQHFASIKDRLNRGEPVARVTVRELLGWFGAERRGSNTLWRIGNYFKKHQIHTVPHYADVPLDFFLSFNQGLYPKPVDYSEFRISDASKDSQKEQGAVQSEPEPADVNRLTETGARLGADDITQSSQGDDKKDGVDHCEALARKPEEGEEHGGQTRPNSVNADSGLMGMDEPVDPNFRVSRLPSANIRPQTISPDGTLAEAISLMLLNDFSQLPVMQGNRTVKGIITWKSIGERLALGSPAEKVRDCAVSHAEARDNEPISHINRLLASHTCVLLRNNAGEISGLVTASDIVNLLEILSEPFLLLSAIENHIRNLLRSCFSKDELNSAKDPRDADRIIEGVDDLTFGEYIRLLEKPECWVKTALKVDRVIVIKHLNKVKDIRNNAMHFDPDGLTSDDIKELKNFDRFLSGLAECDAV
jgi:CBS domain-containing protein